MKLDYWKLNIGKIYCWGDKGVGANKSDLWRYELEGLKEERDRKDNHYLIGLKVVWSYNHWQ